MACNQRNRGNNLEIIFDDFREAIRDIDSKLNRKNNGSLESNQEEMNREKIIKTEDGAVVRKVFVTNIDKRVLKKELIVVFENFGPVHDAFIKKGDSAAGTRINVTFGFVTFFDPQCAYNAIQTMKPIILRHRRLKVRPADTWHQPIELANGELKYDLGLNTIESIPVHMESNCNGIVDKTSNELQSMPHSSKTNPFLNTLEPTNINILNDDCLIQLFSYFTLFELMELEEVCTRWRDVIEVLWQRIHKLCTDDLVMQCKTQLLTTDALRRVLVRCGKHLTVLKISSDKHCFNSRVHQVISKSCPSLQTLHLSGVSSNATGVLALSRGCKELRTLIFKDISGVQDPVLETLFKQNVHLECIHIEGSSAMTGRCLRTLSPSLRELALINCNSLQLKELRVAFRNMKNLQTLIFESCVTLTSNFLVDVADCFPNLNTFALNKYYPLMHTNSLKPIIKMTNITTLSFSMNTLVSNNLLDELSQKCLNLESLDLSSCYTNERGFTVQGLSYLSKFPKLSRLYLNYMEIVTAESLAPIASKGNLIHLELRGCPKLSDTGVIEVFQQCGRLECLDVSGCDMISIATLTFAHNMIKQQKCTTRKLKLIIGGSGIFDDIMHDNEEEHLNDRFSHSNLEINHENLCEPHLRPDFFDNYFPDSDDDMMFDMAYDDDDDFDEVDEFYLLDPHNDFRYFAAGAIFDDLIGDFLSDDDYFE